MIPRENRELARIMWARMVPADEVGAAIGASVSTIYKMARQHKWPRRCRGPGGSLAMTKGDPTPLEIAAGCLRLRADHMAERRASE
jgi:uncharacterized protein YjcR